MVVQKIVTNKEAGKCETITKYGKVNYDNWGLFKLYVY